jgi:hypothetical protein
VCSGGQLQALVPHRRRRRARPCLKVMASASCRTPNSETSCTACSLYLLRGLVGLLGPIGLPLAGWACLWSGLALEPLSNFSYFLIHFFLLTFNLLIRILKFPLCWSVYVYLYFFPFSYMSKQWLKFIFFQNNNTLLIHIINFPLYFLVKWYI